MIEYLGYDDVLLVPILSTVSSRDEVDISVKLSDNLTLKFPLIASPMAEVVDGAFARKLSDLGGIAILHRFYKNRNLLYNDITSNFDSNTHFGMAVKVGDEDYLEHLARFEPDILLIDTANGYTEKLLNFCEKVKDTIVTRGYKTILMAGNVATRNGCVALHNSGCDLIRFGIGGGSLCSTRNQTGIGVPDVSAIMEATRAFDNDFKIVADGGIRYPGDLVKAIAAGATLGMSGKLFAECFESPNTGTLYGMASRTLMENMKMEVKSVEGFDMPVEKKHSLEQFVREFGYGIKSAGTYLNAHSLNEIYLNGEFIKVRDGAIKKGI